MHKHIHVCIYTYKYVYTYIHIYSYISSRHNVTSIKSATTKDLSFFLDVSPKTEASPRHPKPKLHLENEWNRENSVPRFLAVWQRGAFLNLKETMINYHSSETMSYSSNPLCGYAVYSRRLQECRVLSSEEMDSIRSRVFYILYSIYMDIYMYTICVSTRSCSSRLQKCCVLSFLKIDSIRSYVFYILRYTYMNMHIHTVHQQDLTRGAFKSGCVQQIHLSSVFKFCV